MNNDKRICLVTEQNEAIAYQKQFIKGDRSGNDSGLSANSLGKG
jgi:hypothetical protein